MDDQNQQIYALFSDIVGEGGCAGACTEKELYHEDGEWKLNLCGFMEPWSLGQTLEEVEANLRDYASRGFGMGASP